MNRRPPSANFIRLALLTALVGTLSCAPERQHQVLTFFFDGVPPTGGSEQETSGAKPEAGATAGAGQPKAATAAGSVHKPTLDEKRCGACHNRDASFTLVKPIAELCVACHADNTRQFPRMHGPVAVAACAECHEPHRSNHPHLLRQLPPQLCFQCHDRTAPGGKPPGCARPSDDAECTTCHNPHGGKDRFFLVSRPGETDGSAQAPAGPAPEARQP